MEEDTRPHRRQSQGAQGLSRNGKGFPTTAFRPIIHNDVVLLGSEDDTDTDDGRSLYSNMGDLNRIMKDLNDIIKAVMYVCSHDNR